MQDMFSGYFIYVDSSVAFKKQIKDLFSNLLCMTGFLTILDLYKPVLLVLNQINGFLPI